MVANILPADSPPPPAPVARSICQKPERGHVAYQIKGKHECSNMAANILHADPSPQDPSVWDQ